MGTRARKTAMLAMCTAAAMIMSYVELLIPSPLAGVKLGLPNIVIVFVLYRFGAADAAAVSLVRVAAVSLLFGNVLGLWYSLAGAALSLCVMILLRRLGGFSPVGVSVAGGVAHNAGQIAVAIAVTGIAEIGYYMPVLAVSGTLAGILVGIAGAEAVKRIKLKTEH